MASVSFDEEIRHPYVGANLSIAMTVCDGYNGGPLGCHTAMLGRISVAPRVVMAGGPAKRYSDYEQSNALAAVTAHPLTAYVIVRWLQTHLSHGFAHFGSHYLKSHIIISANENDPSVWATYSTSDVIDMIVSMCQQMPEKFGTAVITETTGNMTPGHSTSRVKTLVWVPGYVPREVVARRSDRMYWVPHHSFRDVAQQQGLIPLDPEPVVEEIQAEPNPIPVV